VAPAVAPDTGATRVSKIARIIFSVALLIAVISLADWRSVGRVLHGLNLAWVGIALTLALTDRLILSYRWLQLLAAQGVDPGFSRVFRVQLVAGFLGSFLPTSLGVDAVRMTALCRAGESAPVVIGATLVDRATIVLATLIFGSLTILLVTETHMTAQLQQAVVVSTLLVLGTLAVILLPPVRRFVRQAITRHVPRTVADKITHIAAAALAYRSNRHLLVRIALITAVLFAVRILFVKALLLACGVDVAVRALVLVIPVLWIIVMLPVTVGGLGLQDAGYVALLGAVGVGAPVAVSVSLLEHVISRMISLPGAFLIGSSSPARHQEGEIYQGVARRSHKAHQHPALRLLQDPVYRAHVVRHFFRLPDPLYTADRHVLEGVVFDYYIERPEVRSILFVGCDWYTRHYERAYFPSKNYWTIDPAPAARKFGARQHLTAALQDLGDHLPSGYFELIICNGVFGYGLDSREQCERAFEACYHALRAGGHLIVGWDDIPERTPVSLDEIKSLSRFARKAPSPLGTWRYTTDTPYRHTYDFYCVPESVSRFEEDRNPASASCPQTLE
jgi:uncharacterized protein (TIRG00374 family)